MNFWLQIFLLAGGGSLGSAARGWLGEMVSDALPWVTLGINVSGAFISGWLNAWAQHHPECAWVHPLAIVGLCGGYTTFSSMAFQALVMWRRRHAWRMSIYLALTLALGLGAAWAGLALGNN